MTLNDIVGKIAKHNLKRYLLFCFSIMFAVMMVGAFGILLFSTTVTNVLSVLGSTFTIALALYGITVIGLVIFAIYADNVYMKYKMDEIGVFLSLGLKLSDIRRIVNKEFSGLYGLSVLLGLVLTLPVSLLSWSFLTLFLSTAETTFTIGWAGYGVALAYSAIVGLILLLKNNRAIKNIDIIQILKVTTSGETVKGASFLPGLLGLLCVPVGVAAFWILNSLGDLSNSYGTYSGFGLVLSAIGLYFFIAYITSIGDFFKRFKRNYYLKNLLFFNLVKQKGKQYTLSLFISTLLIAVAIFGICFNSVAFISGYYEIAEDTFGYALLVPFEQAPLINKGEIEWLADEHDMSVTSFNEIELLYVGRQHMYGQRLSEWAEEYLVSASNFNSLAGTDLVVEAGSFVFFSNTYASPVYQTLAQEGNNFYIPKGNEHIQLNLQDTIVLDTVVNASCDVKEFAILNDSDYGSIKETLENKYQYSYYLWDMEGAEDAEGFFNALLALVVDANGGRYMENFNTLPVRELMRQDGKDVPLEDIYKDFTGNELDAARNWSFYPFSRATSIAAMWETAAVYLLLMFFIAIIGFVAATMIIGLRVLNTIWQDETTYKKATLLGMKAKGLKRLVTQQMSLIFFFPALVGASLSILVTNRMVDVTSASQFSGLITLIAVALSLAAIIVEVLVFFALRRKVYRELLT